MNNTKMLKLKIKTSGYKIGFLAKSMKMSRQSLYKKINNCTEFTVSEMQALSSLLKLTDKEMKQIFFTK